MSRKGPAFLRWFNRGDERAEDGSVAATNDISNGTYDHDSDAKKESALDRGGALSTSFRTKKAIAKSESTEDQIALVSRAAGRQQITSRPIDLDEAFEPPVFAKTSAQASMLRDVLGRNFIFNGLNATELEQLIRAFQHEAVREGEFVIRQGDVGDFFYIVETGKIEYLLDGLSVGFAGPGQGFGELALLYDAPRAVSCLAMETSNLWKVDQRTFRTLLARQSKNSDDEIKDLIDNIKLFEHLDRSDKARFINAMTTVIWNPNDRIVQKGSVGNVFYIIQQGQVRVHDIGSDSKFRDQELGPGDFFGERALLTGEKRAANVTALTEVKTLAMDRNTFERTIGPLQMFLDLGMRKRFLQSIPLFAESQFADAEMDQIARLVYEASYDKGYRLAVAGRPVDNKLWIIRHGTLVVQDSTTGGDKEAHLLKSGDYFGDKMLASDPGTIGTVNAIVEQPISTWVIRRSDVESIIGDIGRLGKKVDDGKLRRPDIKYEDLQRMKILGRGGFGTVWLIKYKEEAFALKEMSKRQLIDADQVTGVRREKEMLASLHHPFILNLVSSYQDDAKLYLLLPIVPGGELFSVLQTQKQRDKRQGLRTYQSAFYAAGIIEALGYFHQRLIAYRDLKLENILIDADGYPVIVDLGFAKRVVDKTFTLCGTPEYLAPEIIMSKGHDKACDYWSYGVLVYELLVGVTPFFRPKESQLEMFRRIVSGKFTMPPYIDESAARLIKGGLLVRKPSQRLGNLSRGYLDIRSHEWFSQLGISFSDVLQKKQKSPWKPKMKNPFDASNFDHFEEELYHDGPVTAAEQEQFLGI